MVALIVLLAVVVALFGTLLWTFSRSKPNEAPALGTNNPFPDGVGMLGPGEDEPPYLPSPIISDRELFLRDADRRLRELNPQRHPAPSKSWMDEPGAMEAAGLADEDLPPPPPER
ncbi:MAG: hypothetical protein ACYDAC_02190 [Candidatus Dormibacteria bacterium]